MPEQTHSFKALYKGTRLIYGNPDSNVGIVTLWTKTSELAKRIDAQHYAVMGNLYSAERGLDLLIRNLLANPHITTLLVTGVDFSKSGVVLLDFFEKGFAKGVTETTEKPVWRVISDYEGYINLDIPKEALQQLRDTMQVIRVPALETFDFSSLNPPSPTREPQVFEKQEENTKQYAGEYTGHVIRGKTVAEVWLKILDTILKFGKKSSTHYDDTQKELINILSIITEEDPYNLHIPDFLPQDKKHVNEYIPRITRDMPGGKFKNEYTYGSRMRSWFGGDQIKALIKKLVHELNSRSTVISLWDPLKDLTIGGAPCLNHIWVRVNETDQKLYMTCIFRSHDMFEGYPENAFGLRVLQEEIRAELVEELSKAGTPQPIGLGDLMILSQSAHIYDDSWERCEQTVVKYINHYVPAAEFLYDPRGNCVISIENNTIRVEHTRAGSGVGEGGAVLGVYTGTTAESLRNQLIRENIIGNPAHGLYVGKELQKAEIALQFGIEYIQDEPLQFQQPFDLNQQAGITPPQSSYNPAGSVVQNNSEQQKPMVLAEVGPVSVNKREVKEGVTITLSYKQYKKLLEKRGIYTLA